MNEASWRGLMALQGRAKGGDARGKELPYLLRTDYHTAFSWLPPHGCFFI